MAITWKSGLELLKSAAPSLASAIGGPLAGAAVTSVMNAIPGLKLDPSAGVDKQADTINAAMQNATPEQVLALQKADQEFIVSLDSISNADRANARQMAVTGVKDNTPRYIAYAVLSYAFLGEGVIMVHGVHAGVDPTLIGAFQRTCDAAILLVLGFYFGASSSSQHANELLAASTPAGAPATGGTFKS